MPNNQPPVDVIQEEARAREALASILPDRSMLRGLVLSGQSPYQEMFTIDDTIRAMLAFQSEAPPAGEREEVEMLRICRSALLSIRDWQGEQNPAGNTYRTPIGFKGSPFDYLRKLANDALKASARIAWGVDALSHPLPADREAIARVIAVADAWDAHCLANARTNAAIPAIDGTRAERAVYDERYRASEEAKREMYRAAQEFAKWASANRASLALPPTPSARRDDSETLKDPL